jgi:hypothetical protein
MTDFEIAVKKAFERRFNRSSSDRLLVTFRSECVSDVLQSDF